MNVLSDCRLYGILDLSYVTASDAENVAAQMIDGGVDVLQLRAKQSSIVEIVDLARRLHRITTAAGVPLVVNDYAEVAAEVPVEGVHVGQDDGSIATAREKVGRNTIVGRSTHSVEQANAATAEGADYIGFGPIFPTPTKPDYKPIGLANIRRVHSEITVPIFCIGGIKSDNLGQVVAAGGQRVAIVSGLLKAPEIAKYARSCKELLSSPPNTLKDAKI